MLTLAWKEYREHRLIWTANAGLGGLLLVAIVQLMGTDGLATGLDRNQLVGLMITAVTLAGTYGVVCGSMLLAGERESGTLPFLDTLPGPRLRLWSIKLVIGLVLTVAQALTLAGMLYALGYSSASALPGEVALALVAVALTTFTWGFFASAFGHNVLAAAASGVGFLCAAFLLFTILSFALGAVLAGSRWMAGWRSSGAWLVVLAPWLATVGLGLVGSAFIFCRQDVARAPQRHDLETATPSVVSPWSFRVLWWLNRQQGFAAGLGFTIACFVAGLALPWQGVIIWPIVTLLLGIFCGAGAFVSEQMSGSKRFLAEQRLPLGRIWRSKLLFWFGLACLAALAALAGGALMLAIQGMDSFQHRGLTDALAGVLANHWMPRVAGLLTFGLAWLLTGFGVGQLLAVLFKKGIVAVVLALMAGALLATFWAPAVLCGGVPLWQILVIPVLLLMTSRCILLPWATDRLDTRGPIAVLAGCGVLAVGWLLATCWYRQAEIPRSTEPFDVKAFEARYPDFDADRSGALIRLALSEMGQHEKRVAQVVAKPTRPLCFPPTIEEIRLEMARRGPALGGAAANPWLQFGRRRTGRWGPRMTTVQVPVVGGPRFVAPPMRIDVAIDEGAFDDEWDRDRPSPVPWLRRYASAFAMAGTAADPAGLTALAPTLAINADVTASRGPLTFADQLPQIIERGWPAGDPEIAAWLDHWCSGPLLEPDWLIRLRAACRLPLGIIENARRENLRSVLRSLEPMHLAVNVLTARAIQQQARGKHEEALELLLVVLRLGRQQQNLALPACFAAGARAEQTALLALHRWLDQLPHRPDLVRRALDELSRHERELSPWADSIRAEYLMMSHELDVPSAWVPYALDPQYDKNELGINPVAEAVAFALTIPWEAARARSILCAYYAGRLQAAETPFRDVLPGRQATAKAVHPESTYERYAWYLVRHLLQQQGWITPQSGPQASFTPSRMARHLHASWVQDLLLAGTHNRGVWLAVPSLDANLLATCDLRAARLRLALTLFQMETGRPAEKLAELAPTYLDELPLDPFNGQPFGYVSPAKVAEEAAKQRANVADGVWDFAMPRLFMALPPRSGIVYSVGPDLVDERGFGLALPLATRHFSRNPSIFSLEHLKLFSPDLVYPVPMR